MSNLLLPMIFVAGCLAGLLLDWAGVTVDGLHDISLYILYALMLQVGFSIGCSDNLGQVLRTARPRYLLVPLATVTGSLLFSALAGLLLSRWSVAQCLAVGSGMGYYSLSSILIMQLEAPSIGAQLAAELGTIALLANIFREIIALAGAPLFRRYFGPLGPITVAGVTSVDVSLPTIMRTSGPEMVPVAILHGLLIEVSIPLFVSFFCSL